MRTTNQLALVSLLAMSIVGCGSGSTGGSSDNPPVPPSATSVGVSTPGTLFGITTPSELSDGASIQNIADNSIVYYLPIVNTSSTALAISSVTVSNPEGSTAWSASMGNCPASLPAGGNCLIAVGFNGDNVNSADGLNSIVNILYGNGTDSTIPVSGNIVEPGSLEVQLPTVIAPNSDGIAYGVITVFNGTTESQTITAADIAPEAQTGVTWKFSPNCDGDGSGVVQPLQACSVGFVYQVDTTLEAPTAPTAISVSVPLVNQATGVTTVAQPVSSSLPPTQANNPQPFLTYSGGVVALTGTTASFALSNVGNGSLASISVTGLGGITQTNTCTNVAANGTCIVTLNRATGATVPASITVVPSTGANINITLAGQQLAVSPATLNFGVNYGGATQQRTVTVSNTNATALNGITTNLATGAPYSIVSNNCATTGGTLGRFASCQVVLGYTAPNTAATQTNTFTVGATDQQSVSVALTAQSIETNWNNLMTDGTGYTDTNPGTSIISLIAVDGALLFGNSMAPGVAGARNVWAYDPLNSDFELQDLTGMSTSAPTAIAYIPDALNAFIGKYDGSFYKCDAFNDACTSVGLTAGNFGVTSVVQVNNTRAFAGLSDKSTGTTGALWFYNGTNTTAVNVGDAAVGKMTMSDNTVYVPIHAANQNGQVALVLANGALDTTLDVNAFVANSGEYFTVLYASGSTIYGGTNLSNVYSAPIANLGAISWTKLNTNRLSTTSIVTDLAVVNNQLYVGLGRLNNSISGGALYTYLNSAFITVPGYSDTSSISALSTDANMLYVGTYAGNIWSMTTAQ